jgi:hypothetical protein
MISNVWVPQAIYTMAALGIADVLADGPKPAEDLAQAVGAHAGVLRRLMRALTVLELCRETEEGAFELLPLGSCLRSGTRDSIRAWALLWGSEVMWRPWGHLLDSVRTGESAPRLLEGMEHFDYLAAHPAELGIFNQAMVEMTRQIAGAIPAAYDFSGIAKLVDVGGGYGAMLPAILAANPQMTAVIADLAHCREGALRLLEKTRLSGRCEFVASNMFESVPAGADAYLLKSIIHDWDDERSIAILRNCRAAMHPGSRLLLVEAILPERMGTSQYDEMVAGADLNMLVMVGGRERNEAEFRSLIEAAGMQLAQIVPTMAGLCVIDARPQPNA